MSFLGYPFPPSGGFEALGPSLSAKVAPDGLNEGTPLRSCKNLRFQKIEGLRFVFVRISWHRGLGIVVS
jgi:hypothetical protein